MARVKLTLLVIYLALIGMVMLAPDAFVSQYIFGEGSGSVAIIGGVEENTSVLFSAKPTQWGNILLPVFLFLSIVNLVYLISFIMSRTRRIER